MNKRIGLLVIKEKPDKEYTSKFRFVKLEDLTNTYSYSDSDKDYGPLNWSHLKTLMINVVDWKHIKVKYRDRLVNMPAYDIYDLNWSKPQG